MDINKYKIGNFLKSLNVIEYNYLGGCMDMRNAIGNLIKRHDLSKEFICERFKIKPKTYDNYVNGNYNYSILDMARVNALHFELETARLKEKAPFQITESKENETN